jgi:hypothetical protein
MSAIMETQATAVVERERRQLFRHGALILLTSATFGLVVAFPVPNPAKWMQAHLVGTLTGIMLIAVGGLWRDLHLTDRVRKLGLRMSLLASWLGVWFHVFISITGFPMPGSEPGVQPQVTWQIIVLLATVAIIIPVTFASFFLVWKGVRD